MKVHRVEQKSPEWFRLRAGKVTASEVGGVVTAVKLGPSTAKAYFNRIVAETTLGKPISTFDGNAETERGNAEEPQARAALAWDLGADIEEVGFITTDDGRCGCSPDGMIPGDAPEGCEIKVHMAQAMMGFFLEPDELLKAHRLQVQFSMWVTGWKVWHLYAWNPTIPPVYHRVTPDPKVQAAFDEHVPAFLKRVDEAMEKVNAIRYPGMSAEDIERAYEAFPD